MLLTSLLYCTHMKQMAGGGVAYTLKVSETMSLADLMADLISKGKVDESSEVWVDA